MTAYNYTDIYNDVYDAANHALRTETSTTAPDTSQDISEVLAMVVDDANGDGSLIYQGWAIPGSLTSAAVWRIRKIVKAGNVTTITWADSNINYDNIYDNRGSLTYG